MTKDQMRQVLDALENGLDYGRKVLAAHLENYGETCRPEHAAYHRQNIEACEQAIALMQAAVDAPEAKPVGYTDKYGSAYAIRWAGKLPPNLTLYAAPQEQGRVK